MYNPRAFHLKAVKQILLYFKGTQYYGIYYFAWANTSLSGFIYGD